MVFKTLKSGLFSLEHSLKRVHWRRTAAECILILGLVLLMETVGRRMSSDVQDLVLLVAATPVLVLILYFHHKRGIRFVARIADGLRACFRLLKKGLQMEIGADFRTRKEGPLEESVPYHDLKRFMLAALVFNALVVPFHPWFPDGLRLIGEYTLYTPYLLLIFGLWMLLLGVIAIDIAILAILYLSYILKSPHRNPRAHPVKRALFDRVYPRRLFMLCGLLVLLTAMEILFGRTGWFWLMAGTAVVSLGLAFIPRANENVGLLIKRPASGSIQSISISEWNFSFFAVIQGLGLGLFAITTGAGWWSSEVVVDRLSMPCTYFLGRLFGAGTTFATLFYLFCTLDYLDIRRLHSDPAQTGKKRLLYRDGHLPMDLKVGGWEITPVQHIPQRDEADLYFDYDAARASTAGVPAFQKNLLIIAPRDRAFYLNRADFITKRRIFYRGLARLMKICRATTFQDGAGFIMIPHCYFVEGLHRDDRNEHPEEDRFIGPGFDELWGLKVRRFLFDVLWAMDIDIIYFEDGIRFRELRAVFEIIFELYHNRGPHFRLEEYHFIGLTEARAVVETVRPDLQREKHEEYPETHFTFLSTARILIVFKDRGGGKDLSPTQSPGMAVPEWS